MGIIQSVIFSGVRKMSPMDVVALLHPGLKQLSVGRREGHQVSDSDDSDDDSDDDDD